MSNYKVKFNTEINQEIYEAVHYIAKTLYAPTAASRFYAKIQHKRKILSENPYIYSLVPDKRLAKFGVRFVAVGNYLLFFKIEESEKTVIGFRFIYGRRDWQNMFFASK